jgi:hypothetical protein
VLLDDPGQRDVRLKAQPVGDLKKRTFSETPAIEAEWGYDVR